MSLGPKNRHKFYSWFEKNKEVVEALTRQEAANIASEALEFAVTYSQVKQAEEVTDIKCVVGGKGRASLNESKEAIAILAKAILQLEHSQSLGQYRELLQTLTPGDNDNG